MTENFQKFVDLLERNNYSLKNPDPIADILNLEYGVMVGGTINVFNEEAEVVYERTESEYNSYGDEDTDLKVVLCFHQFGDLYVSFEGRRSSYNGTDWNEIKEVTQTTKTIYNYE